MEFLLTTIVLTVTPGTGVLFTIAAGLSRGTRAGLVAAVACTVGIVPHMLAALTGVAAVLHTSALAFQTLKYLGVAYLLFMAWKTLRDKSDLAAERDGTPRSVSDVITSAVLLNLLNPKLTVFFFAFLPQFVDENEPHTFLRMAELSAVFMLVTLVVFALYGVFAAAVRDHVIGRPRVMAWVRRVFATAFAALGLKLAFL
ncbi:LysE family translocator [Streptomyces alboflavus]|uniref:LysE family translocator n=1 Tax=Streptomyces alboflavus TaxID=67267 RepID=UPI0036793CE9